MRLLLPSGNFIVPFFVFVWNTFSRGHFSMIFTLSVLGFRSRGPVSNPSRGHCAVVLGKALACKTCVTFLRISGEQRRKRAEREARVDCEGRSAPLLTRSSRSPRFRLFSPEIRKKLRLFCRLARS